MNSCDEGNLPNNSETLAATGAPSMKNKRKHIVDVEISNVMPRNEEESNWHCRPEEFPNDALNGKHSKPKEHSEINKGFCDTTNLHDHPREMNNRLDDNLAAKKAKSNQNKIFNPYLKKKIAVDCITRVATDIPSTLGHGLDADILEAVVDTEKGHEKKDTEKDPLHHARQKQAQSAPESISDQKLQQNERGNLCTMNAQECGSRRTMITHEQYEVVKNPYRKDPMSSSVVTLDSHPYQRQTNNNVSASITTTRQLNGSRQPQEMTRHVTAPLPNNPTSNVPTYQSHSSHPSTERPYIPVSTSSNASSRTMPINPYKKSSNHQKLDTSAQNGNGQGLQTSQTASTNNPYGAAVSDSLGVPRPSCAASSPVQYNPYKKLNRDIRNESHSLNIQQPNPINSCIVKLKSKPSSPINPYATKTIPIEDETSIPNLYQHHEGRPTPVSRPLFINRGATCGDEKNNDATLSSSSSMNPYKCANQSVNQYTATTGQFMVANVARPCKSSSDSANAESDQDDLLIIGATQSKDKAPIEISVHHADVATKPKTTSHSNMECRPKPVLNAPSSTSLNQAVKPINRNTASVPSNKTPLPPELAYDEIRLKQVNDEYRLPLIKAADLGGTLKNGWTLLPHQKVGILKAIQMRRLILAYDMGLGKTLIGCVYAKAFKSTFPNLKVHVIAPVSLKKEWIRTASDIVGLKCEEEKKGANGKLDQESLDIRVSSWGKVPLRVPDHIENFVVICDEAHNLQSMDSARTKDTLKLVLSEKCIGCLLLTGTPMKNGKPSNLFPLLRAARHPFGDDRKRYETFFCNGQNKRFGGNRDIWDANGSSNLGMLNAHIVSHMLYKTKDECLKDLPGKKREHMKVPVGSKYEIQHNRALNELAKIFKSLSSTANDSGGNDAILGAFARLRQVAAFAKIEATVALAKRVLKEEPSVVIFTYFVNVAKEVHKGLESAGWTGELLAGETPSAKRQQMVDNFQSGVSPVFIGTFGAAGVGITLTAARTIILMDRPWTPGDALQAEDRVRRIGQTKEVRSIWMRAFDIDEQIDDLIEFKNQNANSVMDKRHMQVNESRAAPKISIRNLVKTIVESNPVHNK